MQDTLLQQKEDKRLIIKAYRNLLKSIRGKIDMSDEDQKQIRKAYELSVKAHSKQRRKSGEPYILHPIEVARICVSEIGLGVTAVIAALLHDVVEDTEITLEEIERIFGKNLARIVDGLTKLDRSYNAESPQAENFKKVLSTLVEDVRVVLIKMADRLHNMRTLGSMPYHKQLKIAAETNYIYAPLAHRLGIYQIKTEFQDLCMKVTDRATYDEIAKKLHETKRNREKYVAEFIAPLESEINKLNIKYRITGRPKSIYSIWNKIKTKKVPFEEIYDLFAIRIIIDVPEPQEKSVCWQVYSIVTSVQQPVQERLKDWITVPKSNGYESLHTTVIGPKGRFVEVQIRSERMDEVAERGFAAHWKYKGVSDSDSNVYDTWLDSVREILDNPDGDAIEFLSDFKTNLFNEEVYVYTPKGDLKILPKGATALDFAFSIHSDVGYHCKSIIVNSKVVPMGYKIQNGDQIKVITNAAQKPTEDWLNIVITGKARSKVRSAMKEERRKQSEFGKEALQRKLKNLKVDFEESVDVMVDYFSFKSRVDLYFAITVGDFALQDMKKHFKVDNNTLEVIEKVIDAPEEDHEKILTKRKNLLHGKSGLRIDGQPADQFEYALATCCNPVQGDDVFAYLTATAGLKIHRTNCPNSTHLMANYGYRIMKAEWVSTTNTTFVADLIITGVDDGPGVIERLTHNISSNLGLNIRSFYIDGNEGYFEGKVSLLVLNKDQLNIAIKALQNLSNISSVRRVEPI